MPHSSASVADICRVNSTAATATSGKEDESATKRTEKGQHYFKSRRKCVLFFASYTLLAIVILELVLISPNLTRPVEAGKKKKMMKKLKDILPLVALLKRKKIILLPIPM